MNEKQIASLGCKLLGIYAIIQSLPMLGTIFQFIAFTEDDPSFRPLLLLSVFFSFLLMLASGVILLRFSNKFAKRMASSNNGPFCNIAASSVGLQSIAFSVVGLVLIVLAIPDISQIAWNVFALRNVGDQRDTYLLISKNRSFAMATGVQFLIGCFIFFGSGSLSSIWYSIQKRLKYEKDLG